MLALLLHAPKVGEYRLTCTRKETGNAVLPRTLNRAPVFFRVLGLLATMTKGGEIVTLALSICDWYVQCESQKRAPLNAEALAMNFITQVAIAKNDYDKARKRWAKSRPVSRPSRGFLRQLLDF